MPRRERRNLDMALKLNDRYLNSFVAEHELTGIAPAVKAAHDQLVNRNGLGSDFLGWIDLPVDYDKEEFARRLPQRSRRTAMSSSLSVSAVLTSAQEQLSRLSSPPSTTA